MSIDRKEFERRKARFRETILRNREFSLSTRVVGYFLADHINFKTGYAWPPQDHLAELVGVTARTVHTACVTLENDHWFRRQLSGRNWLYLPNWLRLETPEKISGVQCRNTGKVFDEHRKFSTENTGKKGDSILSTDNPHKRELRCGSEQLDTLSPVASNDEKESGQQERVVARLPDQSAEITKRARRGGAPQFVFENSEPWRAWIEYRAAQGLGAMPSRRAMIDGRWRTGWDAPTLYPPGFRRGAHGAA